METILKDMNVNAVLLLLIIRISTQIGVM